MWIVINKGCSLNLLIRNSLVGQEYKVEDDPGFYASTSHLQALRVVLSRAADESHGQ